MRGLALLVIVACAACARHPNLAAEAAAVEYRGVPPWAALPLSSVAPVAPIAWQPDGRPVLLLFSASWCPSCPASLLTDVAIARGYKDHFQIGVALVDDRDEDFARSSMAPLLGEVPVWSAPSVRTFAERCEAAAIPMACLVEPRGHVVFRGPAVTAHHVLDAHILGKLHDTIVADISAHTAAVSRLAFGVPSDEISAFVELTRNDPGWQSKIAYQLASRRDASPTDVALAAALARESVAADGGLDYAHLDTYALALSKANHAEDAAMVSWRVLAICSTVHSECMVERHRAYAYIYYAKETGLRWRP